MSKYSTQKTHTSIKSVPHSARNRSFFLQQNRESAMIKPLLLKQSVRVRVPKSMYQVRMETLKNRTERKIKMGMLSRRRVARTFRMHYSRDIISRAKSSEGKTCEDSKRLMLQLYLDEHERMMKRLRKSLEKERVLNYYLRFTDNRGFTTKKKHVKSKNNSGGEEMFDIMGSKTVGVAEKRT